MANSTADMRLSGGHPALDFVNTVDSRIGKIGPDFLRSFGDLAVLATREGLITENEARLLIDRTSAEPAIGASTVKRAVRLREAIYRLFLCEEHSEIVDATDLAEIENEAKAALTRQHLEWKDGSLKWMLPVREPKDLIGVFALSASDLLTQRQGRRAVKQCKGDNCGWLFLDTSKSGRRIWCSDASCGTHSRVKRFRSR
jgi:predicted RNA-binding Zn ribbon-like protein